MSESEIFMLAPDTDEGENHTHREYLGDGVYASFDGYQIWLAANDHRNIVIALEPGVFSRLVEYETRLRKAVSGEPQ